MILQKSFSANTGDAVYTPPVTTAYAGWSHDFRGVLRPSLIRVERPGKPVIPRSTGAELPIWVRLRDQTPALKEETRGAHLAREDDRWNSISARKSNDSMPQIHFDIFITLACRILLVIFTELPVFLFLHEADPWWQQKSYTCVNILQTETF